MQVEATELARTNPTDRLDVIDETRHIKEFHEDIGVDIKHHRCQDNQIKWQNDEIVPRLDRVKVWNAEKQDIPFVEKQTRHRCINTPDSCFEFYNFDLF